MTLKSIFENGANSNAEPSSYEMKKSNKFNANDIKKKVKYNIVYFSFHRTFIRVGSNIQCEALSAVCSMFLRRGMLILPVKKQPGFAPSYCCRLIHTIRGEYDKIADAFAHKQCKLLT